MSFVRKWYNLSALMGCVMLGSVVSRRCLRSLLNAFIILLLVTGCLGDAGLIHFFAPTVAVGESGDRKRDVIVVVKPGANPRAVARGAGAAPKHLYEHVIDGFAASLPPQAIRGLEHNPAVLAVVPDRRVEASRVATARAPHRATAAPHGQRACKKIDNKQKRRHCLAKARKGHPAAPAAPVSPPVNGTASPPVPQPPQAIPTGVDRIDADKSLIAKIDGVDDRVAANVAVLDTGIATHPDLAIAGGVSCLGSSYADDNGHGTHVAGAIGALDNDIGVVGVAPGARLWAVKVLDAQGNGTWSSVICGLDWVYANRGAIDVVNLSVGGNGSDSTCGDVNDPLHSAICRVVNEAGIPVVVAAGNEHRDAAAAVPATYDEVITVSAFADTDGLPGGRGRSRCNQADDTFATFSNYGPDIDIAGPGVCIRSTWLGSTYTELSGTSMATPHVTGAVALYEASHPATTPADVRLWLLAVSKPENSPLGFTGDPDAHPEPALYLE